MTRVRWLRYLCSAGFTMVAVSAASRPATVEKGAIYPIAAVPFTLVKLTDTFWAPRVETNRAVTIPFGFKKSEEEGRIRNFERAAHQRAGEYEGKMPFDDTDVYKLIEGAAYSLQAHPDPELDRFLDAIITKIAAAQEPDGYLTTYKTIDPAKSPAPWLKPGPRWQYELQGSHELYNAGHLYEAAYAHHRATGKRNLLDVALKNAGLIARTFGPGKLTTPPGHQIIETGLVKLSAATGNPRYRELARFFLDQRGNAKGHPLHGPYNQDHRPLVEQREAVGHAVRAAPNPLESDGRYAFNHGALTRKPWFDSSCCPTNLARFIPSIPDYIYAVENDRLFVNLFVASEASFTTGGGTVAIRQETGYPWDGRVQLHITPDRARSFEVRVRVPGWARKQPVPSDLYRYVGGADESYELRLNGTPVAPSLTRGYAVIGRRWAAGDVVSLSLPMAVRRVVADERVVDDRGKVALERGPLVYCAEGIDNSGSVADLVIPDEAPFEVEPRRDLLGGINVLRATVSSGGGRPRSLLAIPYYAWSHRGAGEMAVWLSRKASTASTPARGR